MAEVQAAARDLGTERALGHLLHEAPRRAKLNGSGDSTTVLFKDRVFIDACQEAYRRSVNDSG